MNMQGIAMKYLNVFANTQIHLLQLLKYKRPTGVQTTRAASYSRRYHVEPMNNLWYLLYMLLLGELAEYV